MPDPNESLRRVREALECMRDDSPYLADAPRATAALASLAAVEQRMADLEQYSERLKATWKALFDSCGHMDAATFRDCDACGSRVPAGGVNMEGLLTELDACLHPDLTETLTREQAASIVGLAERITAECVAADAEVNEEE